MTAFLRDYQDALLQALYNEWRENKRNVLAVLPTGGGKTRIKAKMFADVKVPGMAIAHRQELVGQISRALASAGTYHRIIAPQPVINFCVAQHIKYFGGSRYHPQAPVAVGGVDTVIRRHEPLAQFFNSVRIWDIDEAHHVLEDNKWGKAVRLFPNAWGAGFTATPLRADRKSLGRSRSGVFDAMVIGPNMRELINRGYLTDYRIFAPTNSIDWSQIRVSEATGELNEKDVKREAHKSRITGDIVESYLKFARGKRGITFVVDVDLAGKTADAYNAAGVRAAAVSAETPDTIRQDLIEQFGSGQLDQLVNVDLFGEGFDVPACEVVSMGRPTLSYGLFIQQFGRALRPHPGKQFGILLDHVENVAHHGLPDRPRIWSITDEERGKRSKSPDDVFEMMTCEICASPFDRVLYGRQCPHCSHVMMPGGRSLPAQVDGELEELSPDVLKAMRGEAQWIDGVPVIPIGASDIVAAAVRRNWHLRQEAQRELRDCIDAWAGIGKYVHEWTDSEIQRRFYYRFGIDVLSAAALDRKEAQKLTQLIRETMT